jgi:enamine deaminase RidA (YjgF/YER057c/UK114 family)
MADADTRLEQLGITLPDAAAPVANYLPCQAVHSGVLIYISGQIPLRDGALLASGRAPDEVDVETATECARQCVLNGLATLRRELGTLAGVRSVVRVGGFVASAPGFGDQPKIINGASDLLVDVFGESGKHARAAVGVAALPLNAPVEIEFTFLID